MGIGGLVCLSFLGSLALAPVMKRIAWAFGAISRPDLVRRHHARPMPLWGGVGVYFGFLVGAVAIVWMRQSLGLENLSLTASLTVSAGLLCVVGMIDDRHPLSAWGKLPGQTLAVLPVIWAGLTVEQLSCFGWELHLGWFAVPCTIFGLLLGINALNLLDGSDGLASTVGIVILLALAAVASTQGLVEVAILALVTAGALTGFLVHNLPPARIYLGDCGSTLIGFVVASLALVAARTEADTVNLTTLVLLVFVPLLDTGLAIVRRTLKGQVIWSGDRGHLHHQLQDRGFTAGKVLVFLGALCVVSGMAAWSAMFWRQEGLALLALAGVTLFLVQRQLIAHQEWTLLLHRFAQFTASTASHAEDVEILEPLEEPIPIFPMTSSASLNQAPRSLASELAEPRRRAA